MDRRIALIEALENYSPTDPVERGYVRETLALLESDGDPFARDRFSPGHITASGFVLSPEYDRLLLVHHAKLHRWLQPGGHVDPKDATIEAASAREVREETGTRIVAWRPDGVFDLDIHEIPARGDAPCHRHYDVRFLWVALDDALVRSDETLDVAWVELADLPGRLDSPSLVRVRTKVATRAAGRLE